MTAPMTLDDGLRAWATPRQLEFMDAIAQHGSIRAAARALSVDNASLVRSIQSLRAKAAMAGHSPQHDMRRTVPEPFVVKGVSTYYDQDGKPRGQWVKSRLDGQAMERALREAAAAFVADLPALPAPPPPVDTSSDVIPWIQIGDAHIGMLAHEWETGHHFNLETAEAELLGAIGVLIDEMPKVDRCVINDLGDATHYDNFSGTTAQSGHALDIDGRFPAMLRVYSRVMRQVVDRALRRAAHVDVIVNQGNHSRVNDFWAAEMLRVVYGQSGRVHVLNNDSPFVAYRMGKTLVMVHHGDKVKPRDLIGIMTTDFRADYGATQHHYIDIGHVHHRKVAAEHPGVIVESWNNLAPNDKWAHDMGYRARRSISMVLRSRTYGEIGRRLLPVEEVRDRIGRAIARPSGQKLAFQA